MDSLRKMTIEELTGIIHMFPWFGEARVELCRRTSEGNEGDFREAAVYATSRRALYEIAHRRKDSGYVDSAAVKVIKEAPVKPVRAAGGDFFSQNEYDMVRQAGDDIFSSFVTKAGSESEDEQANGSFMSLCTETLAQIYAEQGYPEQAKYIYSKLCLRYPEKNAYFAALIEKLDSTDNN